MPGRIPHGHDPVEVRQAIQRMDALVGILDDGTTSQYLIGQGVGEYPVWIDPVVLTAGSGIAGGGNISADRTFDLDINSLSVAGIAAGDYVPFWDITATATNKKITFANFEATLDHDSLAGFVSNEHIDHSGVSITAGSGLSGGGDITTTRTIDLDINSLSVATIAAGDFLPFWDITATATNKKITFANLEGTLDHDSLTGYVSNEHIDHTGVTITAGNGLAGTSSIETSFTLSLDINELSVATIVAGDFVPFWDITATATNKKTTFANFEAALTHDNLISGTIADHDTSATGAQLDTLTDDSMADTLHRHSELSASDGFPNQALIVDHNDNVGISELAPFCKLHITGADQGVVHHAAGIIFLIESGETVFQIVANDGGANAAMFCLSCSPASGDNKHWIFHHSGPTAPSPNAFEIGYMTSSAGNFPAGDVVPDFLITTSGDVGINTTTPDAKLQVVGTSRFGEDTTNYSEFESDGTLEFNGNATVWKDINIGAATLSGPPGKQPDIVNFVDEVGADTGIATYGLAVGEGFSGTFEMQHDYKEGSDITFHVHFQGIAAPTGTDKIQFQLTYTIARFNDTVDAVTVLTAEADFDTQYESQILSFSAITGTNIDITDQFLFTLERIAASADEYGGEALMQTVGIHYEVDTIGSRQITTK